MSESKNSFIVTDSQSGQRLDVFLCQSLSVSRGIIQKAIKEKHVTVNGSACKAHYLLKSEDKINATLSHEDDNGDLKPEDLNLSIIYEDNDILVVDKPAGISVHPGAGKKQTTLANGLLYYTDRLSYLPGKERPGIVHRLDKDTTGCLVVARTDEAYLNLKSQFQQRNVDKTYIAVLHGRLEKNYMKINTPIKRNSGNRKKMQTSRTGQGRESVTKVTLKETAGRFSLAEVKILTGRTHQIRVHLSSKGFPVVGDITYGKGKRLPEEIPEPSRQMLHAWKLEFTHPSNCNKMLFEAKWPKDIISTWNLIKSLYS